MGFDDFFRNHFNLYVDRKDIVYLKDRRGSVWDFLAGLVMGMVGYTILSEFVKPKCPKCSAKIDREISVCPVCKTELLWKA